MRNFFLDEKTSIELSTNSVPTKDKLEYWNDHVCQSMLHAESAINTDWHNEQEFRGTLRANRLEDITFFELSSSPQIFRRTKKTLAKLNHDSFVATLPLFNDTKKVINSTPLASLKGDIAIFDGALEQQLSVLDDIDSLIISIPKDRLKTYMDRVDNYAGTLVSTKSPSGFLLSNYIQSLSLQIGKISEGLTESICDNFLQLFIIALTDSKQKINEFKHAVEASQVIHIKRYIQTNYRNHTLTPQKIADAHHISLRQLYSLFENEELTIAKYILKTRLTRCYDMLSKPENKPLSITTIALDSGFNDVAHFSRLFKQNFGVSPRDFRMQNHRSPNTTTESPT